MILKEENIWKTELLTMDPSKIWLHWGYCDEKKMKREKKMAVVVGKNPSL